MGIPISRIADKRAAGEPIVMVTAYDFPSARVAAEAGVDMVLVGDSGAMTVLGYDSTVPVTVDEMLVLASAVRRGLTGPQAPVLVADLPFGSYEVSDEQAVATAQRFVKEAGADAVKVERGGTTADRARTIVAAGIPVVGHVGLTPQTAVALGGYKAQGRSADAAMAVQREARDLESAGCCALVFEAVPSRLSELLVASLGIPVIGIGAGPDADGQVLVFHDLLGITTGPSARFVKRFADVHERMVDGVRAYAHDVRAGAYPAPEHCYTMPADQAAELERLLADT